jgi:hypothetical protein
MQGSNTENVSFLSLSYISILYGVYDENNGNEMTIPVAALYNAVHKTVWGAAVCWVIFACANIQYDSKVLMKLADYIQYDSKVLIKPADYIQYDQLPQHFTVILYLICRFYQHFTVILYLICRFYQHYTVTRHR